MTNCSFLRDAASECTTILNKHEEIKRNAPKLNQYIKSLDTKDDQYLKLQGSYAGYMIYYTTLFGFVYDYIRNAEEQLLSAQFDQTYIKRTDEEDLVPCFKKLENLHYKSSEDVKVFLAESHELKDVIVKATSSMEKLRKDTERRILDLGSRKVNIEALQLLSGAAGIGTAGAVATALIPAIPFTLTALPMLALAGTSIAGFGFLKVNADIKESYTATMTNLTRARSKMLEAETMLKKDQTELAISRIEERIYGEVDNDIVLQRLQSIVRKQRDSSNFQSVPSSENKVVKLTISTPFRIIHILNYLYSRALGHIQERLAFH